jgi:surfeit locus 1 family protein
VAAIVVLLIALGLWQLERFTWQKAQTAYIHAQIALPTVPLPVNLGRADGPAPETFNYRYIEVEGHFLNDHEFYLIASSRYGNDGLDVLTPFVRLDGGGIVIINRGWIPKERRPPASRPAGLLSGTVTVEGIAHWPPPHGVWLPSGDGLGTEQTSGQGLTADRVDSLKLAGLARLSPDTLIAPMVVDAGSAYNPGGLPVGGQTVIDPANDHLQYAFVCFGLAVMLILIYVILNRSLKPET